MKYKELERLVDIVAVLRSENGCQWDREQTHKTLRANMLEEAYEAVDAIDSGDMANLREELGDVLLQVILHSQIAKDGGIFNIEDVAKDLADKLIHRHPHVFGDAKVNSTKEILDAWDRLKKEEKTDRKSVLDGLSKSQSALMAAQKISKKVVKVGFEWDSLDSLKKCVQSEYKEFEEAVRNGNIDSMEDEMGDILFATVNYARWHKIDAEQALLRANKKFVARFKKMEEIAEKPLEDYTFEEYDLLWKKAKKLISESNNA
jgi:tetrapyrrole methylase family protein/MazG family protein